MHFHRKLGRWLPPGGHIEDNELPDDAAVREVLEETGVRIVLVGGRGLDVQSPRQLVLPAGMQLEPIYPGHEHVDLVYFAVPEPDDATAAHIDPVLAERDRVSWLNLDALAALDDSEEIQSWASRAIREVEALTL
jgi:8-oxo-dGTP pyrophosphatase MutT (NUDIX family)